MNLPRFRGGNGRDRRTADRLARAIEAIYDPATRPHAMAELQSLRRLEYATAGGRRKFADLASTALRLAETGRVGPRPPHFEGGTKKARRKLNEIIDALQDLPRFDHTAPTAPTGNIVVEILVTSLGYQDDDLRITIDGQVASNTKWRITSYHGENFLGPGGNPNWKTEGYRIVRLSQAALSDAGISAKEGSVVAVDLWDGYGSAVANPWIAQVTWSDGLVQNYSGGSHQTGNTGHPPAGPEGYWDYYKTNGSFVISR